MGYFHVSSRKRPIFPQAIQFHCKYAFCSRFHFPLSQSLWQLSRPPALRFWIMTFCVRLMRHFPPPFTEAFNLIAFFMQILYIIANSRPYSTQKYNFIRLSRIFQLLAAPVSLICPVSMIFFLNSFFCRQIIVMRIFQSLCLV